MQIKWSRKAKEQASKIVAFIRKDNPQAAQKWISEVLLSIKTIPSNPFRGRVVPEIEDPIYREILRGNYRIIYKVTGQYVFILTIHHSKRLLLPNKIDE